MWHMVQTLNDTGYYSVSTATSDVQRLILSTMSYFGMYGNLIFFISSTWFLLDSKKVKSKKILFMLLEIWTISVVMMVISYIIINIYQKIYMNSTFSGYSYKYLTVHSLFPTVFGNNWYITCYVLFYPLHTLLNKIVYSVSKKQLLIFSFTSLLLYSILSLVLSLVDVGIYHTSNNYFFSSQLLQWCILYLGIGYIKLYMKSFCKNKRLNIIIFFVGIIIGILFILFIDFLGLRINYAFQDLWIGRSMGNYGAITMMNPFVLLTIMPLFNIFNNINLRKKGINWIAKFSLLIYLLHENIFFRHCFRPFIFIYICTRFENKYMLFWVIVVSLFMFICCLLMSILYEITLKKLVNKFNDVIYSPLAKFCSSVIDKLMKFT